MVSRSDLSIKNMRFNRINNDINPFNEIKNINSNKCTFTAEKNEINRSPYALFYKSELIEFLKSARIDDSIKIESDGGITNTIVTANNITDIGLNMIHSCYILENDSKIHRSQINITVEIIKPEVKAEIHEKKSLSIGNFNNNSINKMKTEALFNELKIQEIIIEPKTYKYENDEYQILANGQWNECNDLKPQIGDFCVFPNPLNSQMYTLYHWINNEVYWQIYSENNYFSGCSPEVVDLNKQHSMGEDQIMKDFKEGGLIAHVTHNAINCPFMSNQRSIRH